MSVATILTRGLGNGTFDGTIPDIVLSGHTIGASAPSLLGNIPDISATYQGSNVETDLSAYFSGATSYAIAPAVETGWTFNTSTGVLTVDTDEAGTFGTYVVTASNVNGDTDSNAFSVVVAEEEEEETKKITGGGGKVKKRPRYYGKPIKYKVRLETLTIHLYPP